MLYKGSLFFPHFHEVLHFSKFFQKFSNIILNKYINKNVNLEIIPRSQDMDKSLNFSALVRNSLKDY